MNLPVEVDTLKSSMRLSDHLLLWNKIQIIKNLSGVKEGVKWATMLPNKKTSRKITEEILKEEFPTIS